MKSINREIKKKGQTGEKLNKQMKERKVLQKERMGKERMGTHTSFSLPHLSEKLTLL